MFGLCSMVPYGVLSYRPCVRHEPSKASTNSSKKCDSSTQLQQIHGSWVIIVWSAVDQEIHGTKQAKQSHWLSASPVCPTGLLYTQQLLAQIFQPRVAGSILSLMSYVNTMVSFRRKFPCETWCLGSCLCHLRGIIHALKSSQHPSTILYWTALGHHRCWKKSCTTYRMYKTPLNAEIRETTPLLLNWLAGCLPSTVSPAVAVWITDSLQRNWASSLFLALSLAPQRFLRDAASHVQGPSALLLKVAKLWPCIMI